MAARHAACLHVSCAVRAACRRHACAARGGSAGGPKPGRVGFYGELGGAEQLHDLQSLLMWVYELLMQNTFELGLPGIRQNVGARSPST
jgi:hypothetical protein